MVSLGLQSELWSQTVGFISRLHSFLAVSSDKLYTSQRDYTKKLFVHKHVSPVAVSGIFSQGHGFWAKIQGTKHTIAKSFPKVFLFLKKYMQPLEPSYTRHSLTCSRAAFCCVTAGLEASAPPRVSSLPTEGNFTLKGCLHFPEAAMLGFQSRNHLFTPL